MQALKGEYRGPNIKPMCVVGVYTEDFRYLIGVAVEVVNGGVTVRYSNGDTDVVLASEVLLVMDAP